MKFLIENELEKRHKKHKKTIKPGAMGSFIHPDGGNQVAIDTFNNSVDMGNMSSTCLGEALNESYDSKFKDIINYIKSILPKDTHFSYDDYRVIPDSMGSGMRFQVEFDSKDSSLQNKVINSIERKFYGVTADKGWGRDWDYYITIKVNDRACNESLNEDLKDDINIFIEDSRGYSDYNQIIDDIADEFNLSKKEAENYVWEYFYNEGHSVENSYNESYEDASYYTDIEILAQKQGRADRVQEKELKSKKDFIDTFDFNIYDDTTVDSEEKEAIYNLYKAAYNKERKFKDGRFFPQLEETFDFDLADDALYALRNFKKHAQNGDELKIDINGNKGEVSKEADGWYLYYGGLVTQGSYKVIEATIKDILNRNSEKDIFLSEDYSKEEKRSDFIKALKLCAAYDPNTLYIDDYSQKQAAEAKNREINTAFDKIMMKYNVKSTGVPAECTNLKSESDYINKLKQYIAKNKKIMKESFDLWQDLERFGKRAPYEEYYKFGLSDIHGDHKFQLGREDDGWHLYGNGKGLLMKGSFDSILSALKKWVVENKKVMKESFDPYSIEYWNYDPDEIEVGIEYCENNFIDPTSLTPTDFENIVILANGYYPHNKGWKYTDVQILSALDYILEKGMMLSSLTPENFEEVIKKANALGECVKMTNKEIKEALNQSSSYNSNKKKFYYDEAVDYLESKGVDCDPSNVYGEYACDLLDDYASYDKDDEQVYYRKDLNYIIKEVNQAKASHRYDSLDEDVPGGQYYWPGSEEEWESEEDIYGDEEIPFDDSLEKSCDMKESRMTNKEIKEALNKLDMWAIDNDTTFYDLKTLYEAFINPKSPIDQKKKDKIQKALNDPTMNRDTEKLQDYIAGILVRQDEALEETLDEDEGSNGFQQSSKILPVNTLGTLSPEELTKSELRRDELLDKEDHNKISPEEKKELVKLNKKINNHYKEKKRLMHELINEELFDVEDYPEAFERYYLIATNLCNQYGYGVDQFTEEIAEQVLEDNGPDLSDDEVKEILLDYFEEVE